MKTAGRTIRGEMPREAGSMDPLPLVLVAARRPPKGTVAQELRGVQATEHDPAQQGRVRAGRDLALFLERYGHPARPCGSCSANDDQPGRIHRPGQEIVAL